MHRLLPGLMFAALWASASVATKFGVAVADPLILANVRFFIAGVTMLLFAYAISRRKHRIPHGKEWRHLFIFSLAGIDRWNIIASIYITNSRFQYN